MANVVLIGATLPAVGIPLATTSSGAHPLFEYIASGPSTWSTQSLAAQFDGHSIVGSAHAATGDGEFALGARLENGDLGLYVENASGTSSFNDVTAAAHAPAAAGDPDVFLDPFGNVDLIYVSTRDRLIMISPAPARAPRRAHVFTGAPDPPPSPYDVTDLSAASHVPMSPGLPSISVSGASAVVFDRSSKGHAIALPLQWRLVGQTPAVGIATDVTASTGTPDLASDPVSLPGATNAFAATTAAGHVLFFTQAVAGASPWSASDVTTLTSSPASQGSLSLAANGSNVFLASLSTAGHVQLFSVSSSQLSSPASLVRAHVEPHVTTPTPTWSFSDLTSTITGSPLWTGQLFLSASASALSVAGRDANLGDLFDYSAPLSSMTWSSKDVSLAAGASTSASTGVTGVNNGSTLQLFAPSDGSLAPQGVGVYAIPYNDWGRAITDGWPIVSETGGLGTLSSPWVGFPSSTSVSQSSDFLMGQSIENSQRRETWLSFWTVSGPLTPATQTPATYYSHGFLAGQWVAQQIDQYRLNGVGLKPNWVILDPEGYPDNHSALDAPGGSTNATIHRYATYWTAMLAGWSTGINDVDPSLHPAVYASQSEYRDYGLASTPLPVFQAVAFGDGGPVRVPGSDGHNILGYIAFDAVCTPTSTLRAQEHTLLNSPWGGQFNTLQFNPGVYCAP